MNSSKPCSKENDAKHDRHWSRGIPRPRKVLPYGSVAREYSRKVVVSIEPPHSVYATAYTNSRAYRCASVFQLVSLIAR